MSARVTFTATEAGTGRQVNARFHVNGQAIGSTPLSLDLPVGSHTVIFEPTRSHESDTASREFRVVPGQTTGAVSAVYRPLGAASAGSPPGKPPTTVPTPTIPTPIIKPRTFPCPAGDGVFATREDLRRHIFEMQSRADSRHINIRN